MYLVGQVSRQSTWKNPKDAWIPENHQNSLKNVVIFDIFRELVEEFVVSQGTDFPSKCLPNRGFIPVKSLTFLNAISHQMRTSGYGGSRTWRNPIKIHRLWEIY